MSQESTGLSKDERKRYRKRTPENAPAPSTDPKSLMDTVMLARHIGKQNKMAVTRLRRHTNPEVRLPEPDLYLGPVPHWFRGTIDDYLQRQVERAKDVGQHRKELADKAIAGRQARRAEKVAGAIAGVGPGGHTPQPSSAPRAAGRRA